MKNKMQTIRNKARQLWKRAAYALMALPPALAGAFVPVSANRMKLAVSNRRAEGFIDTAVKVLMAVVIGALVLAGLYLLFKDTILPELTRRIQDMFNYTGG